MMLLSIIKKEMLHVLRDKKAMFLMVVFPILMMVILGTAFSGKGGFASSNSLPETKVMYSMKEGTSTEKDFKDFVKGISSSVNVTFTETKDEAYALSCVQDGKYDCYVKMQQDDKIQLYSNKLRDTNASLVETLLNTFVQKHNAMQQIVMDNKNNPMVIEKVTSKKSHDFATIKSVQGQKVPSAIDYYAVTMFTMTILYGIATGASVVLGEVRRKTLSRIYCSYVSRFQLALGKIIGACAVTFLQVILVYATSKYLLHADWGDHTAAVLLVAITQIVMAVCIGIGVTSFSTSPNVATLVINLGVPVMVFLGGGYMPLNIFGNVFKTVSCISPIKWTNQAIFGIIYGNDVSSMHTAIAINLATAAAFIVVPALFRKREVA